VKIDRAIFVQLTAALAASTACGKSVALPGPDQVEAPRTADPSPPSPPLPVAPVEPSEPLPHDCKFALPKGVPLNPTCEGANWAETSCHQAQNRRHLPPEARVVLTQCLDKNAGTRAICSVEETYACSAKALALVKPDSATAEACERVVAVCGKKTSMAECQGVLTIRPGYRERAEFCLIGPAKSCNPAGWCAFGDPDTKFVPRD
jgi:hypothetical protein